ncbi:MAG: hypothetical protein V1907_00510 [Candidatus Kerfeldbacteria bacterium]
MERDRYPVIFLPTCPCGQGLNELQAVPRHHLIVMMTERRQSICHRPLDVITNSVTRGKRERIALIHLPIDLATHRLEPRGNHQTPEIDDETEKQIHLMLLRCLNPPRRGPSVCLV